jgi:hypothetical protein
VAAPKKIFISYFSDDKADVVGQLRRELTTAGHVPVGDWALRSADRWADDLKRMLEEADGVVIVVNRDAFSSAYMAEIEMASMLKRAEHEPDFRFAVLMTPDVTMADLQDSPLARLADTYIPQGPTIEARITEVVSAFGAASEETVAAQTE